MGGEGRGGILRREGQYWEGEGLERGEVVLREGDQIFLPAGYRYTMQSTGEPAVNVFAIAGGPTTNVDKIIGPEATERLKSAAGNLTPR